MRFLGLCLLAFAPAASAAELCEGACSISLDFANGGRIEAAGGTTIAFGEGGSLVLGDGGSITGGAVSSDDLGLGGTLVLEPGGVVEFGPGGSLATGEQGGASVDGGSLDIGGFVHATVQSAAPVHFGTATATTCDGQMALVSGSGGIQYLDTSTPVHFTLGATADGGEPPDLWIATEGAITYDRFLYAGPECPGPGAEEPSDPGSGGLVITTGGTTTTTTGSGDAGAAAEVPATETTAVAAGSGPAAGGGLGLAVLLGLGLAGAVRRRGRLQCAAPSPCGFARPSTHVDPAQDRRPDRP